MEKFVLKSSGNCKQFSNGDMITMKANFGVRISSKVTPKNDDKMSKIKKSLYVRNDKLAELLKSTTFQPLFIDSTDMSNKTSSNICDDENMQPHSHNEELSNRFSGNTNLLENMISTPMENQMDGVNVNAGTPRNTHILNRLQRDLDSPSAATRLRALRALKSPANGPYNFFDVPHEEQDIITEEERRDVVPKTIQDVMKDVVIYVEMRHGDENRTCSIKGVIAELGAKINDNLNRNTTHIIFKEGTQSTYNKAKNWNIPIVNILWIEECKKQLRLVDPAKFPITNIERYENPDLYKKTKVKKFFQTGNELKIVKPKKGTPTLEKFDAIKIPKKAKDNLTGILNDFRDRLANNADGIDYFSENSKLRNLVNVNGSSTSNVNDNDNANNSIKSTDASLLQTSNVQTPFSKSSKRKTMYTPKVMEIDTPRSVRVTRRTSLLASVATPLRSISEKESKPSSEININQTKNNSEGMDITLYSTPPSSHINVSTNKTTSAMEMTNSNQSEVLSQPSLSNKANSLEKIRKVTTARKKNSSNDNRRKTRFSLSHSNDIEVKAASRNSVVNNRKSLRSPEGNNSESKSRSKLSMNSSRQKLLAANPISNEESGKETESINPFDASKSFQALKSTEHNPLTPIRNTSINSALCTTPQNRTLFDEYCQRITFSSTNKRQSIADVSLHIVEQRMKNINEVSRLNRSVSESDVNVDDIEKCLSERLARSSPQLGVSSKLSKKKHPVNEAVIPLPKKRKLYDPAVYDESSSNNFIPPNVSTPKNMLSKVKSANQKRRSINDFQSKSLKSSKTLASTSKSDGKMNFLAYTNVNRDQVNVINKAIKKLGKFTIETRVTNKTTHLVTFDSKRTQNFLRAIIRGLWILNYEWITASLTANAWLYEGPYENRKLSTAVS